jgi:hypothetical protein
MSGRRGQAWQQGQGQRLRRQALAEPTPGRAWATDPAQFLGKFFWVLLCLSQLRFS